jgi:hypothetical protein
MEICPLTNHSINLRREGDKMLFYYENPILGTIKWTDVAWVIRENLTQEQKDLIKGVIRNRKINGEPPLEINSRLVNNLEDLDIPYDFESRARHFLKYLYDHGGKEFKVHGIDSATDSAISYSSRDEFEGIVRYLKAEGFIDYNKVVTTKQGNFYQDLSITKGGIKEIEKGLPKMPLCGLFEQKISSGDIAIDNQIEHARNLFFDEHPTIEKMRSACETLMFVIEPLRDKLKDKFSGDTEFFFNIVNNFTIRHNKERTRTIETPEQLEWIFYSLLNTINTYVKFTRRKGAILN